MNNTYNKLASKHQISFDKISKEYNLISFIRISLAILFMVLIYFYFKTDSNSFLWAMLATFFTFYFVMKWHDKVSFQKKFFKKLIAINTDEINYLNKTDIPFEDGQAFLPKSHDYAFDLDFFGNKSLYQNINRTATFKGKNTLAELLLTIKPNKEIKQNQEAIYELASKIDFRQEILALAQLTNDSQVIYQNLLEWAEKKTSISIVYTIISIVMPVAFFTFFVLNLFYDNPLFSKIATYLFIANLGVLGKFYKKIKAEIQHLDSINKTVASYGLMVAKIENETFESEKLKNLQSKLNYNNVVASEQIKSLSSLFKQIESILNPFSAVISNGLFQYHIHSYRKLSQWKNNFASQVPLWLDIIGEFETLNSFANLLYNNPNFCFPKLNENFDISFTELGHPLISEQVRVNNNVDFNTQNFIILTGSNMSGKSTFLRSLGINMVLAGIGAPICAKDANIHPLNVLVSMRLTDSLEDNESYFFAEVKRLKEIMNKLDKQVSFVLLDEILRGTNSDDKRQGTIEVIKKMISKKAIGAIATHDLEVCKTTDNFPDTLTNKNFEVEIIDNELVFDYKLRNGICKNKSATFLMKKMEVI